MASKLISLELTNFKSFRQLLLDDLEKFSIIAIVGDNGQGKSNIIDGILYALGINHLKTLRITKLSDLVYCNDAEDIEANSCTVKLKLQIDMEINIFERSSSVSGQNQYLFNGTVILHHDYLESLKVIGANVAAQNFFIMQGNIQQLANLTDMKMTVFLERVSGSDEFAAEHGRYKKICKKAEEEVIAKRIEMNRLKKRHRKVQRQVEHQEEREILQNRLDKQRVLTALFTAKQLSLEIDDIRKVLEKETRKQEELTVKIPNVENKLQNALKKKEDARKIIRDAENNLSKCDMEYKQLDCEKTRLMYEYVSFEKLEKTIEKDIENLRKDEQTNEKLLTNWQVTLQKKTDERNKAQERLERRIVPSEADKCEYFEIKTRVEQRLADKDEMQGIQMNYKLSGYEMQYDTNISMNELGEEIYQEWQAKYDTLKTETALKTTKLANTERHVEGNTEPIVGQMGEVPTNLDKLRQDISVSCYFNEDARRRDEEQEQNQLSSRFAAFGKMRDLVKPVQPIIWAESDQLNSTVVDAFKTAVQCGQHLNITTDGVQQRFLPLESLKYEEHSVLLSNIPDMVPISSLLTYDDNIRRAVLHSTENAIMVADDASAQAITYGGNRRIKAVTKDNTRFHASGLIGVHLGMPEIMRNATNDVHSKINAFSKNLQALKCKLNDTESQTELRTLILKTKVDLQNDEQELVATEEAWQFFNIEYSRHQDELQSLRNKINKLKAVVVGSNAARAEIEDQEFESFCERMNVNNIKEYKIRTEMPNNLRAITESIEDIQRVISSLDNDLLKAREDIAKRLGQIQTIQVSKISSNEQIQEVNKKMENTEKAKYCKFIATYAEKLEGFKKTVIQLRNELCRLEHQKYAGKDMCEKQKNKEKSAVEQFQFHLQQCAEKTIILPEEAGDLNQIDYQLLPIGDLRKKDKKSYERRLNVYETKIKVIEEDIAKLGLFEEGIQAGRAELNIEHRAAVAQFNDAVQALRDAEQDVDRLAVQRTERLTSCLNILDASIDRIYKELTGSYCCAKIMPLDVEAPYSAGISYMVTVRNKGFQQIKNISSGEKTMAALALYYALREYKPSPILLLDEVDAHLDPHNLYNLASFLRNESAENRQAIVITHKPDTASKADVLMSMLTLDTSETVVVKFDFNDV